MLHHIFTSRIVRTILSIALVISAALLITNTVYAAFFIITIGDGAVDPNWNEAFIWDDPNDSSGEGDIEHAYFATNGPTPTTFSFRIEGINMTAGFPSQLQVCMDCNANGSFSDTVDRFIIPRIFPWGGEVFDGTGNSVGVFVFRIEDIGTTDIEWTVSSELSNWGDCSTGSIYLMFDSPTSDRTPIRGYNITEGHAITTISPEYRTAAPGSFINVTGEGFPAGQTGTITINSHFVDNVLVAETGQFTYTLTTSNASEGYYHVAVSVNPSASTSFILDSEADFRVREGSYPTVDVPAGIAFTHATWLPVIQR